MLRCPSSLLTAAYRFVRLIRRDSGALPLELFTKPFDTSDFQQFMKFVIL